MTAIVPNIITKVFKFCSDDARLYSRFSTNDFTVQVYLAPELKTIPMIPTVIIRPLGNADWSEWNDLILNWIIVPFAASPFSPIAFWLALIETDWNIAEKVHFDQSDGLFSYTSQITVLKPLTSEYPTKAKTSDENRACPVSPFSMIETIELFVHPGRLIKEKLTESVDEFDGDAQHRRNVSLRLSCKHNIKEKTTWILFVPAVGENREEIRQHTLSGLVSVSDSAQMAQEKSHPGKVPLPPEIDQFRWRWAVRQC